MRRSESHPLTATGGRSAARSRRMLAAVALAGSAALLAACASPGTSPTSAPPQPSTSTGAPGAAGAAPVELADELLQSEGLFDEVSEEGFAVRWLEPGESIAVVIGGSGGGGGCIPQPHAAEQGESGVLVAFDPPDPAMMCTADFRLHGWELGLASPVDATETLTVMLENLRGEDESTDVEIGPDDLLDSGPTADPQPSLIPTPPEDVPAPSAIPAEQLPSSTEAGVVQTEDPEVGVRWIEPGVRLAVLRYGSGADHCTPTPVAARSTGIGMVEVSFEFAPDDRDCSADGMLRGWAFTLPERVPATQPVEVTVTGASRTGATAVLTLQPDDLLDIP
ncbi:MAG: hypothetical protein ACQEWM_00905 [Actinomycetota bacterium]